MNKTINMERFSEELFVVLDELYASQADNIKATAEVCAQAIIQGGVIQVFGSGHSIGFGLEMWGRAGSLVPVHNINMSDFVIKGQVTYDDFRNPDDIFERRPGIADKLYGLYNIAPQDAFIIISNSGINGVVIDMAIYVKQLGHPLIVVTSWQHTSVEDSRHPSGKKLYELADIVIDNCGPRGDALIETGGLEKICSISSITGAFIAQTIASETCECLIKQNFDLPILWPETRLGSKSHNTDLEEKYKGRV